MLKHMHELYYLDIISEETGTDLLQNLKFLANVKLSSLNRRGRYLVC